MVVEIARSVRIFVCYAHEDEILLNKLKAQLSPLQRQGYIDVWHDRELLPGTDWNSEIDTNLKNAHIILLLISPDFISSDYCYGVEMKKAMQRYEKGEAHVIPIILRPVHWEKVSELGRLEALPTKGKPVTRWPSPPDYDDGFFDVAKGAEKVISAFFNIWKGDDLCNLNHYEEALDAYQEAINLKIQNPSLLEKKGTVLFHLKRYEEALAAYNEAIRLDNQNPLFFAKKGKLLFSLRRYEDALIVYNDAIYLDPQNAEYYSNKGDTLFKMEKYEEACIAYEDTIRLEPHHARTWQNMGKALFNLMRNKDALETFEEAIRLEPQNAVFRKEVGDILVSLERLEDALAAYEKAVYIKPDYGDAFLSISGIFEYLAIQAYNSLKQRADEAHEKARQLGVTK